MAHPPIQLRVHRGEDANTGDCEWVSLGICTSYKNLEVKTFHLLEYDDDKHSVHFHFESHDRCEAKVKPNLWDKGVYFTPKLLSSGSLRLMPHFSEKRSKSEERVGKRERSAFEPVRTGLESTKRVKDDGAASGEVRIDVSNNTDLTLTSINTENNDEDDDDFITRKTQQHHPRGKHPHPPPSPHPPNPPSRLPRLPPAATYTNWLTDFSRLEQAYITQKLPNTHPTSSKHKTKIINRHVHKALIDGIYGVPASKPCAICPRRGRTCRIYHPGCYAWAMSGIGGAQAQLGWRCAGCRVCTAYECDVQGEVEEEDTKIEIKGRKRGDVGMGGIGAAAAVTAASYGGIDRIKYIEVLKELGMPCQDV